MRPFFEFSGVKDSKHNLTEAVFKKDSTIRKDMEDIINRRTVSLIFKVGQEEEVLIVVNFNIDSNFYRPPTLQKLSGYTQKQVAATNLVD